MPKSRSTVIAVDGPDNVGKTTQIRLLAEYLQQRGKKAHLTKSLGGSPISEALRKVSLANIPRPPETDLYISLAASAALAYDVESHQQRGEIVIIDRSPLSIIAYQAYGSRLPQRQDAYDGAEKMLQFIGLGAVFLLSAPVDVLNNRKKLREKSSKAENNNYYENQNAAFHARVRKGYEAAAKFMKTNPSLAKIALHEIDAAGAVEVVQELIRQKLRTLVDL